MHRENINLPAKQTSVANMSKAFNKLHGVVSHFRWLVRGSGLHRTARETHERVHEAQDRFVELEQKIDRLQSSLDQMMLADRSSCTAFGHLMQLDPSDTVIAQHLAETGCFEPFETKLVQDVVRPGSVVIDVGANIGYYTLQFAKLVGAKGHVYAFEPDPSNFRLLSKNVAVNGYANVTCIQKAVSDCNGTTRLFKNEHNRGDHRIYAAGSERRNAVEVETIRLDDFVEEIDQPIDLLKFDIQGAEAIAFAGMTRLLNDNRNLKIITEFWPRGLTLSGHDPRKFLEELIDRGFDVKVIDEQSQKLHSLDIDGVLVRYPVEFDTDILFTNLYCSRAA
jgi:FkbM family methyltransferase